MSVTKKNQPIWAGIVVTGGTKEEAVASYSSVAQGEDVVVLASANGESMIATASSQADIFSDPSHDGQKMTVVEQDFEVTAGNNQDGHEDIVSVAYTVCPEETCGTHIIADDPESVSNCPECNASVDFDSLEEEELESESSDSVEETNDQGLVIAASTFERAQKLFVEALQNPKKARMFASESGVNFTSHAACDVSNSPFDGSSVESEELSTEALAHITSVSSGFKDSEQAHYFNCFNSECSSPHIISLSEDATLCPSCSSGLIDPEDLAEMEQAVLAMNSDMDMDDDEELDLDDDMDDMDDDMDLDDEEDDDDLEDEDDFEVVASSDDDDDDDDLEEDDDSEIDGLEDEDEDEDDDMESDSAATPDVEEDIESESTDSVVSVSEINAMSVVAGSTEGGLSADKIALVNCSNVAGAKRWLAFHGETPIAVSSESNVSGALSGIFGTPSYATAVQKAISLSGVEKGLEEFGFKAIAFDTETMQVAVANNILAEAQAKVATFEQAQQDRDSVLMDRLGAALSTSMMGLDREVFAGKSNPIIHSLASALNAAGVANARSLVDNVFESNATAYNKLVVEQVKALLSKSADTQNELAQMVASSSYARKGQESTSSSIEDRLSGARSSQSVQLKSNEQVSSESSSASRSSFAELARARVSQAFNS